MCEKDNGNREVPVIEEEVKQEELIQPEENFQNEPDVNFLDELLMGQVDTAQNSAPGSHSNQISQVDENKYSIDVQTFNQQ
jgi:hypothetical protein